MISSDLIIIGAGPGGYRAAELAAKNGLKVVIFSDGDVGGTCLNVGCIPTKTYVHSGSFQEARERMLHVVEQLRSGVEQILAHPNITLIRGKAHFINACTVGVEQPLTSHSSAFTSQNIIIAIGSETKWLPVKGADDDPRVVDSTGLLQLDRQPKKLAVIGAGVIGMEFASIFNRFGTEVTVTEYMRECLPALDSEIAKRLRKCLEKRGITFRMKTAVENVADIDADVILMATGRKPRVQPDFANAGIVFDERTGIKVNACFETTTSGIYAIGDVNVLQMLAHAAEFQAKKVVERIVSGAVCEQTGSLSTGPTPQLESIPAAIFTTPEAACVGPSEERLRADGRAFECRKAFHRANGRAMAMGQTDGMLKLFSEPRAGRILGCHCFGAGSAGIVQEVSVLMDMNASVQQLRNMVHIHPTAAEVLLAAAEQE